MRIKIPADFPVRPLKPGATAKDKATCGTCGLSWDDAIPTTWTPVPSGRCPFEYFHAETKETKPAPSARELLRRGFECGIFDDAPNYKRDVKKLLKAGTI